MTYRLLCLIIGLGGVLCGGTALGQAGQAVKKTLEPVSGLGDEASRLVNQWYREGTGAGNVADSYDNRDRGHSMLDVSLFPQVRKVQYSDEALKRREDWGGQRRLARGVLIGNSSTSAGVSGVGSNARSMYYTRPSGMAFLYAQYRASNLYVYPEHHDHDVGRDGSPGYGDLFPVNSPYVVISQGSSFSDKAFLHALFLTSAAFRPEVKRMLVSKGMLMPTLQFILRASMVRYPVDYLKGAAHPTVFDGRRLLPVKMVKMAHEMEVGTTPPLVQLEVKEEAALVAGRDYFEAGYTEKLADTLSVVGRVFRGVEYERRMVVSAARSLDIEGKKLTYHWVVLRGDPNLVEIKESAGGVMAEIRVKYQGRREINGGSGLESSRIDIGVFVHNGDYFSAPGFVTFCFLENEQRRYGADGEILEVDYQAGSDSIAVKHTGAFFSQLEEEGENGLGWALIRNALSRGPAVLSSKRLDAVDQLLGLVARRKALAGRQMTVDVEQKIKSLDEQMEALAKDGLGGAKNGDGSVLRTIELALSELLSDQHLLSRYRQEIERRVTKVGDVDGSFAKLVSEVETIGAGAGAMGLRDRRRVVALNRRIITELVYQDSVNYLFKPHFAIQGMGAVKPWLDVYSTAGEGGGWKRYFRDGRVMEFDEMGQLIKRVGDQVERVKVTYAVGAGGQLEMKEAGPVGAD